MNTNAVQATEPQRFRWLRRHWTSLLLLLPVLAGIGVVNGWNMSQLPGLHNEDEATYATQAWAILNLGQLSTTTYWYDHPAGGWSLIAAYAGLTGGFDRTAIALVVGREFMLLVTLVSCGLLYMLARRRCFHRLTALLTVAVFGLSPLAVYHHRMVFLDNIAVMFALGAMVLAVSPRRSLGATFGSAMCMAAAFWSKETALLLAIPVLYLLIQNTVRGQRAVAIVVCFLIPLGMLGPGLWLASATIKSELFPGEGHVSLWDAVTWQLYERDSSGSLLDTTSGTFGLAQSWFNQDPWFVTAALLLIPFGLYVRRLRPIAVGLLFQVVIMMWDHYTPQPYVISLLPFAALLIGGFADILWRPIPGLALKEGWHWATLRHAGLMPLGFLAFMVAAHSPVIAQDLRELSATTGKPDMVAAAEWVKQSVSEDEVVVTDNFVYLELLQDGFSNVVWYTKVDTDPQVMAETLPNGWESISYIILSPQPAQQTGQLYPTLRDGLDNSEPIETFGNITVHRVVERTGG